jgi:sugar transferase (PEP-CTERM system associated)
MIRLFRVFIPTSELALFASEIVLVSFCYTFATFLTTSVDPTVYLLYDGGLARIALATATIIMGLHLMDLYTDVQVKHRLELLQRLCLVIGIAFLMQGLASYIGSDFQLPRTVMLVGSLLALVGLHIWRLCYSAFVLRVMGGQKLLFVGWNSLVSEIAEELCARPTLGMRVAGYLNDELPVGTPLKNATVLGPISSLRQVVASVVPDRIVVGLTERRQRMPVNDLLELRFSGFPIEEAAATYEKVLGRICTKELRPGQLIFSGELGPRPNNLMYQMLVNVSLVLTGLIVASPLMALIALGVKLTSKGPALYRQSRVGLDGAVFTLYKFRSMRTDAEKLTGAVWASKDDPRVTPFGRVLRKLRLDELPQLINVIRGEMSLVGPRPERPEFVRTLSEQIPYYRQRHCVRPGITGWAQINHKYGDTLEDTIRKLEYDLYYIKYMSFGLDLYIIFHTMKTMLLSRGSQ